ncbi:MAG: nucleotidyltransferase family protein [Candidatus Omnitrophota bacterium]|jgi:glucose-1-phosphate thymidylyltransferase
MTVIILAAGYAVRLQPLTLNTSKSLLEINKRKILDRILDKILAVKGISKIFVVSNAKFFEKFSQWLKGSKYRKMISLVNDGTLTNETRLGAIKDMELVIRQNAIDDDLMVVAGDNLFDFDLNDFLKFAKDRIDGISVALFDIAKKELAKNFGVVKIDDKGKIVLFEEKPPAPQSSLVSTGVYYFPKNMVPYINEYVKMENKLDAPGYYVSWLVSRGMAHGFRFKEDWYDIGNIESYKKANEEYARKERGRI